MNVASSLETDILLVRLSLHHGPLKIRRSLSAFASFSIGHDMLAMIAASWDERQLVEVYYQHLFIWLQHPVYEPYKGKHL